MDLHHSGLFISLKFFYVNKLLRNTASFQQFFYIQQHYPFSLWFIDFLPTMICPFSCTQPQTCCRNIWNIFLISVSRFCHVISIYICNSFTSDIKKSQDLYLIGCLWFILFRCFSNILNGPQWLILKILFSKTTLNPLLYFSLSTTKQNNTLDILNFQLICNDTRTVGCD